MRLFVSVMFLCGLIAQPCFAADDDAVRAKVAIALSKAKTTTVQCDCAVTGVCTCDPDKCTCPGCPLHAAKTVPVAKRSSDAIGFVAYKVGRESVCSTPGQKMAVWIGGCCLPCVREMKDYIHCQVDRFQGQDRGVAIIKGEEEEAWLLHV